MSLLAKNNRPAGTAFKQQKLTAWQPILTPKWIICAFAIIGTIFIPLGVVLKVTADGVVEYEVQYDGKGTPDENKNCMITSATQGNNCTVTFTTQEEMKSPIFVYYELANFYQNHRRYVKSRSDMQLRDDENVRISSLESSCDPSASFKNGNTGKIYWPCGLIANSYFNDKIVLNAGEGGYKMSEDGIAWESDLAMKFKNPKAENVFLPSSNYEYIWDTFDAIQMPCKAAPGAAGGRCEEDNYDPTAKAGVRDEHLVVWMRTAGLPTFRKLYGRIESNKPFPKNTNFTFQVSSNFVVNSFNGKKFIVISTGSWLGGRNSFLGIAYIAVGTLCVCFSLVFFVKHRISPRRLGDTRYLVWRTRP